MRSSLSLPLFTLALVVAAARGAHAQDSASGLSRPPRPPSPAGAAPAAEPLPDPAAAAPVPGAYGMLPSPEEAARRSVLPDVPSAVPTSNEAAIDARIDAIDDHLGALAARRTSSIGGGVVSILMGGAYLGLGAYAAKNGSDSIARYFYLVGGASVVSAGVQLGLRPNPERAYDRLQLIRSDTSLSPGARLRGAEHLLASMARRRMAARYVQGAIDLGLVVASLPVMFGDDGFDSSDGFDWLVATSAGIGTVQAITTMFQRSEEERRYRLYRTFAERQGGASVYGTSAARPRLVPVDYGLRGLPGGTAVSATFVF